MGANAFMNNMNNMDPATYGLTTKAECREKISKLKIEIAKLKEELVSGRSYINKDNIKWRIASRKTDIEKIKAHMEKCKK